MEDNDNYYKDYLKDYLPKSEKNKTTYIPKRIEIVMDDESNEKIKKALGEKYDEFRTKADLAIVHNILDSEGNGFFEKAENYRQNCINTYEKENNNRYKIKHRAIYG